MLLLKIKIAAPGKFSEAAVCRYFSKKMFLKISHFHRKTPVLGSLFNKAARINYGNLIVIYMCKCKSCFNFRDHSQKQWLDEENTHAKMPNRTSAWVGLELILIRSSRAEVLCKKVFLQILQNSQGNTSGRVSFLIKL